MTKKLVTGQIATEVFQVPVGCFEFIEGPQEGHVCCEKNGHLISVIPGSENGLAILYDGSVESGKVIANLILEQFHATVIINVYYENSLTIFLDDDAKITVIHDHASYECQEEEE